jgi:glycosyltransferase involved in cell wall biosynthesis
MLDFRFSVVIPTYNRCDLIGRAIKSVLDQDWPDLDIVVVDDASTDRTGDVIPTVFPRVRYFRQDRNRGQCEARNRGIREARWPWILFLDDDDVLLPGALSRITARIELLPDLERYPAFQFSHTNGRIPGEFLMIQLQHYMDGTVQGDFMPIIRKDRFVALGLSFPENRSIGERVRSGEHLLWWKIAGMYGIPTWTEQVAKVYTDAAQRNTSSGYQMIHACDFARLHERTLSEFGDVMADRFPGYYDKERLSAAMYWLLAGNREIARSHLRFVLRRRLSLHAFGLWVLSVVPQAWTRQLFVLYRRRVNGWR